MKNMRIDLYNSLQKQDFDFFDRNRTGDIMNRLTGDIDSIRHFAAWVLNGMVENLFLLVTAIVILGFINPFLTAALCAVTPFTAITAVSFKLKVKPAFQKARARLSELNAVARKSFTFSK